MFMRLTFTPANKSTTVSFEQSKEAILSFSVIFPQLNIHFCISYEYLFYLCLNIRFKIFKRQ